MIATEQTEHELTRNPIPPQVDWSGRLGSQGLLLLQRYFTWGGLRRLGWAGSLIPAIRYWEQHYGRMNDAELMYQANELRGEARLGKLPDSLIVRAFGLCSVSVWRTLGMRPYDVQLAAGAIMVKGGCCELATGEGKTLTAIFPSFLHGLVGKGIHVATVNDYLAKRDADQVGPVFERLGLTVGFLQQGMQDPDRQEAYAKDITYGTASEFGFDFLRDRLKMRSGQVDQLPFWSAWVSHPKQKQRRDPRVQRGHYYALVDEADSIFIDEAKTPLIISLPTRKASPEEQIKYRWANQLAQRMVLNEHFIYNIRKDKVELKEEGNYLARYSNPPTTEAFDKLLEALEKALHAHHRLQRDYHYMVSDEGKVIIIDESTGRPMPDRQWRDGLHQAVECKEGLEIHKAVDHAASITFQTYFQRYQTLAGMSGTLIQNAREIRKVYKTPVVAVPTNRPVLRKRLPDRIFLNEEQKFAAIVQEVKKLIAQGRPVLIGTCSVEKSERLAELLQQQGIEPQVLNARQNAEEAKIVAQSGQAGRVTVATNMAGRGTDIRLGEGVRERGGLHVIGTELHESVRIDRQLLGRAGRQGDLGSGQFYLCWEDRILEALGVAQARRTAALARAGKISSLPSLALFRKAQRVTEKRHLRQRLDVMHYDKQRSELLGELGADPFVD